MTDLLSRVKEIVIRPRWSGKEESVATKRLSLLIGSGMSVPDAVGAIAEGARGKRRGALIAIREATAGGDSFARALTSYPGMFSLFSREVIRVAEESGSLAENLAYLSRELEKRSRLQARLLGALMYPLILLSLTLVLSVSLILFVFPKVLPLFSGLGAALPLSTQMMIALSEFLSRWGIATLAIVVVIVSAFAISIRYLPRMERTLSRVLLRVPLIGGMIRAYRLSGIARSLGILLSSGASLPNALANSGRASANLLYAEEFMQVAMRADEGQDLRAALHGTDTTIVPTLARDILAAGEASGALPEAAFHLATYYENEFDEAAGKLSTMVEPVLMILMGLIVGFVAVSMILPIYSITSHLRT